MTSPTDNLPLISGRVNIAQRLRQTATAWPDVLGVVAPNGEDRDGNARYVQLTFQELDNESDRLASGLQQMGVGPGVKLVLMVRPSIEFIALTFAIFKLGAVVVLIDPGMGRSSIFRCLAEVEPEGFVAIPPVHVIRLAMAGKFPKARFNVTVGRRWFWGGKTYGQLRDLGRAPFSIASTHSHDPAAIIFTSGSTGPPKGVLYEHGMFDAQVDLLQQRFNIEPGEVDLPGFPLFALFNAAMGVTTVVPDMNPTRPANVEPRKIIRAMRDQGVTQAFGSPAMWNRIGRYAEREGITLPNLRRVFSAGAPVPIHVVDRMRKVLTRPGADIHTPYGATESLPVAAIDGRAILEETAPQTRRGAGVCVGTAFPNVDIRIITIQDEPIEEISKADVLPTGEIGEIIVRGPMATREYYHRPDATRLAKISDGETFWHRMGDVGYLDGENRLWICGRKAHIVHTKAGPLFTVRCEAIFNEHPQIYRSALVGVGDRPDQLPVIIAEPFPDQFPRDEADRSQLTEELLQLARGNPLTENIRTVLFHPSLPVDIRHNVKIFREKLAPWATQQLS